MTDSFNSLSRDHIFWRKECNCHRDCRWAFNSLSRDHVMVNSVRHVINDGFLSTPSLGITNAWILLSVSWVKSRLSTPSLGITEPYSGIFRLSAAFRRGAPSHICIFRPIFEDITATKHHDSNRGFKRNSRCTFVTRCSLYFLPKFSCKIATTSKTHQLRLAGIRTSRVRRRPCPASGRYASTLESIGLQGLYGTGPEQSRGQKAPASASMCRTRPFATYGS